MIMVSINIQGNVKISDGNRGNGKVHVDQTKSNIRPTKKNMEQQSDQTELAIPEHLVFESVQCFDKVYTDLTLRLPVQSSKGMNYVFLIYSYDTNTILIHPLKNQTATAIYGSYTILFKRLTDLGFKPSVHWLDNEARYQILEFNKKQMVYIFNLHHHIFIIEILQNVQSEHSKSITFQDFIP